MSVLERTYFSRCYQTASLVCSETHFGKNRRNYLHGKTPNEIELLRALGELGGLE